jgi:DnaJ family protein C protein 13
MSFLGSLFSGAGGGQGSNASKGAEVGPDVLARHNATKVHAFRGKYVRVFCMTPTAVHHVDPDTLRITNSWPWADVSEFSPAVSTTTDFTLTVKEGASKKTEVLKFVTDQRSHLLCDLARFSVGGGERDPNSRRFVAVKITRASLRQDVALELGSWYIAVLAQDGSRKSLYTFKELTAVRPLREDASAVAIYLHGRARLFALPERGEFLRLLSLALTRLALTPILLEAPMPTAEQRAERLAHGNDASAPRLGEYDVLKASPKYASPRPRKLVLTEASFTERDASTYAVVSSRPLRSIFNIVRHWDDPTKLSIEYRDGSTRAYLTSLRDALLGSLLDAARNAGNEHVGLSAEATKMGDRASLLTLDEEPAGEAAYLAQLGRIPKAAPGSPYNPALVRAAHEFNCNVSPLGLAYATKRAPVAAALGEVVSEAVRAASLADCPSAITVALLGAITRIVASKEGAKVFMMHSDATPLFLKTLAHEDAGIAYASFELLRRLLRNPRRPGDADEDAEAAARKLLLSQEVRVLIIHALDLHSGGGGGGSSSGAGASGGGGGSSPGSSKDAAAAAGRGSSGGGASAGNEGTLVVMSIVLCLDTLLVSHVDTTPGDAWEHLMQLTASRYSVLLGLFRCRCSGVVESATLLMRAIVEQADLATCRAMQNAALSSGVWLRHFFNSAFAASADQRYVSRYLVELWSTGNSTAREVLRHMLPAGLLLYLDMPKLKTEEAAHMSAVEAMGERREGAPVSAAAAAAEVAAAQAALNRGLAGRLRTRIEQAERSAQSRVRRRIAALDEGSAGAKRGFFGQRLVDVEAERARSAAAAAAVSAAAAMTKAKIEGDSGKEDNYTVMFFQVMQDHMMPDLIWNQQTRGELRASLEAELREIEREIELGGTVTGSQVTGVGSRVATAAAAAAPPVAAVRAAVEEGKEASAAAVGGGAAAAGAAAAGAASVVHTVTGGVDLNLRVRPSLSLGWALPHLLFFLPPQRTRTRTRTRTPPPTHTHAHTHHTGCLEL